VSIGEDSLTFIVKIYALGELVLAETVHDTAFSYNPKDHIHGTFPLEIFVAQVSSLIGVGPFQRIIVDD